MVRLFGRGRAFSSHIEKKKSKCDYRFDRALTPAEVEDIERRVNTIIAADLPVVEEFTTREEAERLFDTSRLPDSAAEKIRVVRIGDYDSCPCSGAHASRTGELGTFSIISTDFENGILRIRFRVRKDTES